MAQPLLKKNRLKSTPARLEVLKVLSTDKKPQTAQAIYKRLGKKYDLATIYRNLEKFEKKKLIFKEHLRKQDYYYLAKSLHHHIVCQRCELMECIPCSHQNFSVKNFTNITHQLLLTGTCAQCAQA